MSNATNQMIQDYLETCYQEVIAKALRNGLDYEALYRYMQEMYLALPEGFPLSAQYKHEMIDAQAQMLQTEVNIDMATTWVFASTNILDRQLVMLSDLMTFIEKNETDEVVEICAAQLNYIKQTLWLQRRVLDTILAWAPSRILLHVEGKAMQEYAETLERYAEVNSRFRAMMNARAKNEEKTDRKT